MPDGNHGPRRVDIGSLRGILSCVRHPPSRRLGVNQIHDAPASMAASVARKMRYEVAPRRADGRRRRPLTMRELIGHDVTLSKCRFPESFEHI